MAKRKNIQPKGKITVSGNFPRPGQTSPSVIVLTQPKRFGIDIADFTQAIRAAENVDFSRRYRLYDLYDDILLDAHLSCVIEKRRNAVLCSNIEFWRDGIPDEAVNEQIRSPWFSRLVTDIIDAKMWGFSLCQFYREDDNWVNYDLIPRKHADPVRRLILRHQTDITGTSWDEYPDLLFIGSPTDLGLLAKAAPWVIYKRNTTGDWSQFSEVFGMPIQEYTYDTDDDDSRQRAIDDAYNAGSLAVFVHGKDTNLNLVEAGNKTGTAEVYERLCERCNNEISKLILGNTLTTESSDNGTQALGTVHKKVEDRVAQADRRYILDVLNYNMADIFQRMGINTNGGEFCFPEQKDIDPATKMNILTQLRSNFQLPVADEFLYEEFGIEKPADYDKLKQQQFERQQASIAALQNQTNDEPNTPNEPTNAHQKPNEPNTPNEPDKPDNKKKSSFHNWLKAFFAKAPNADGADLEW